MISKNGILQPFIVTAFVTTNSLLFIKALGSSPTDTRLLTNWKPDTGTNICSMRVLNSNVTWKGVKL